jgi:hypothetical protein
MKNSKSIRISEKIYKLLQAKKDKLQKEKGKKITYNQLLKYLIVEDTSPKAGILLKEDVKTRVKKYAEEHSLSLSETVNNLLIFAIDLRKEIYIVLTSDLKEEFKRLFSFLDRKEKEKLKDDLKKIITFYTKRLLKSYSKKMKR